MIVRAGHQRDPLTLSLSSDGLAFDRAWALRSGAPPYRYPLPTVEESGKVQGFSYPDSVIVDGVFWVRAFVLAWLCAWL